MELFVKFIESAEKWQYKPFLPVAIFLACLVGALYCPLPDGVVIPMSMRVVSGLVIGVATGALTWYFQQPPTVRKGSIGIVIAIRSEDKKVKDRISNDFIETCKNLLGESRANQPFHLVELNSYFSELAKDPSSANILRLRCKGHMLIFGDAVQRKERGKNLFVFRLRGIVCHTPAPPDAQSLLAHEMNSVLPLKEEILEDNELSGFEVTSIQLAEATKYVIATAALISHDYNFAILLLEELYKNLGKLKLNANVKAINNLIRLIPNRLADAYRFASTVHFARWEVSREESELQESITFEQKHNQIKPGDQLPLLLMSAIFHFVKSRDINAAMSCINQCRSKYITHPAWKYSAAFLEAYRGNLDKAKEYYDAAITTEQGFDIPFQVEGFIAWILDVEPDMKQLNFCLGYINEKIKDDSISAQKHYYNFLNSSLSHHSSTMAIEHAMSFQQV